MSLIIAMFLFKYDISDKHFRFERPIIQEEIFDLRLSKRLLRTV